MNYLNFKKLSAMILAVVMLLAIAGCGNEKTSSEYWVYEDVDVDNDEGDAAEQSDSLDESDEKEQESGEKTNGSKKQKNNNSKSNNNNKSSNNKSNNNNKKNNSKKYNFVKVGTKGANGKDYSNYNPYAGIEKYKGKTVKYATWINHQETEWADPIKSFYNKYGIKVETVFCVQANYLEQVNALIAAGKAPDIVVENANSPSTFQIAQEFSATGLDVNEPFWDQKAIKGLNPKSKTYFVNSVNSTFQPFGVVVFQRDIMEANGIKTPANYYKEGKWTIENMLKCAREFKSLGKDYSGVAFEGLHLRGIYNSPLVTFDGNAFKSNLVSQGCIDAGKLELKIVNEKLKGSDDEFVKGKTGIIIRDSWSLKKTGYLQGADGDSLGFTYLPTVKEGDKSVVTGFYRGYGIAKGSKNAVPAGMFLRYVLDPENIDFDSNCFFNDEATNFFYEMVAKNQKLTDRRDYGYGIAATAGVSYKVYLDGANDENQVATAYKSHVNEMNAAISKANKILNSAK